MQQQQSTWTVIKLGGTSVSSADYWRTIAAELAERAGKGERVLVVQSAISGVTDLLEKLLAAADESTREEILDELRRRHEGLAESLGVDNIQIDQQLDQLRRQALGAVLTGEVTPRLRAAVLASGELMASRISISYLQQQVAADWLDIREHLVARVLDDTDARHYLGAACESLPDRELQAHLEALAPIVLTQGFIASDTDGRTVLLGRGGSDTSAAILAARIEAGELEIWTDVPGMYTANPQQVPAARLLKRLDYDEALEIASTGAKVLHPRCIEPLRAQQIRLRIRYTPDPSQPGTEIGPRTTDPSGRVKAVSARRGIRLVEMSTSGMWQQVGFLADAFAQFRKHGLSIDLVSTSETTVTVSLDPMANSLDPATLARLQRDLSPFCRVRLIEDCAAISLVGRRMRANLHRLAPVLELFDERRVHLVTQAANDLNFTVVVDDADAPRLVRQLHALVVKADADDDTFGPAWQELGREKEAEEERENWWKARREELLVTAIQTPCYVYDRNGITCSARAINSLPVDRAYFAVKANNNPDVLRLLEAEGLGFECVSPGEIRRVLDLFPDIDRSRLLFTPNFAPRTEYEFALDENIPLTLDNIHALREWASLFAGRDILLRIDPGQGDGHHRKVRTAGSHSKFGIPEHELAEAAALAESAGAKIIGLHAHVGSGIRDPQAWQDVALSLARVSEHFPDARILDLGGGFGVPERRNDIPLDMTAVAERLQEFRDAHPKFELWVEPGRYLVATAGALLTRVTQLKGKAGAFYVGVDAGMHTLLRPALYGAHHDIVNLSRLGDTASITANVVGPICETGDILGIDRRLPETREGDVLLIGNAGAYGSVMSSDYNLRGMPREFLL
ncbi:MAG: bifunctional aspartate kinase/diaminopimelate decarboxylase [Gammaproteobacteria bacterium]|nr:bifunctional aspartate kinase/diaminopimelate decarboxylase [Gammaproteobacteria bacterium]